MEKQPTQTIEQTIKKWAVKVMNGWRKSVDSIMQCGQSLIDAKKELRERERGAWRRMMKRLPFSEDMVQQLMTVARDPRLRNPDHGRFLPASWRTLFELTKLTDGQFERGIASGDI